MILYKATNETSVCVHVGRWVGVLSVSCRWLLCSNTGVSVKSVTLTGGADRVPLALPHGDKNHPLYGQRKAGAG